MESYGWILDGTVTVTAIGPDAVTVAGPGGQTARLEYVERDGRGTVLLVPRRHGCSGLGRAVP
jgi:hypothetical protein